MFRELNKQHFNFCRVPLRQRWAELIAKRILTFRPWWPWPWTWVILWLCRTEAWNYTTIYYSNLYSAESPCESEALLRLQLPQSAQNIFHLALTCSAQVRSGGCLPSFAPVILVLVVLLHCALSLAAQCTVIDPVCGVCLCVGVCYHDNSKLRASISPNWVCRWR